MRTETSGRPPNVIVRTWRRYKVTLAWLAIFYLLQRYLFTYTFVRDIDPMLFVQIGMALVMQILQVAFYFGFFFYMLGGRIRVKTYLPGDLAWSWDDYKGSHAVAQRLQLLVRLLVERKAAKHLGGVEPAHTALIGPPGTGKTYAALIVAAEAGVPVVSVETSSLLGTFIGIGPLKVYRLFARVNKLARIWGGAVLFLDEIDAIASGRAGAAGGGIWSFLGGNVGGQILSTFLACLSGLNEPHGIGHRIRAFLKKNLGIPYHWERPNVLVLVSTNVDLALLDRALFRSGRIGQHIKVRLPTRMDLPELVEYYLCERMYQYGVRGVPHDSTCDAKAMARLAAGCSQADISRAMNDAKRLAVELGLEKISLVLWMRAVTEARMGLKQVLPLTERDRRLISIHEAGHGTAALAVGEDEEIPVASIDAHGDTLGHVWHAPLEEHILRTGTDIERHIMISLASLAAENVLGERTPGTTSDLDHVKLLTILLISQGIIGHPWMVKMPKETGGQTVGAALSIAELSEDGEKLAAAYYDFRLREITAVLEENRKAMEKFAALLAERGTVHHDEIMEAVGRYLVPHRELEEFTWEENASN